MPTMTVEVRELPARFGEVLSPTSTPGGRSWRGETWNLNHFGFARTFCKRGLLVG
jgi:hypothetical protein